MAELNNKDTSTELIDMSNAELHRHGTGKDTVTPLENELLHRLEAYIEIYGDYVTAWR